MSYYLIKIIHIVSASAFIGILIGTLIYNRFIHQDQTLLKKITQINMLFSLIVLILQPISGFILIMLKHYNPMAQWVLLSLTSYAVICCLCFILMYTQYRTISLPENTKNNSTIIKSSTRKQQAIILAIFSMLALSIYLMTVRPA